MSIYRNGPGQLTMNKNKWKVYISILSIGILLKKKMLASFKNICMTTSNLFQTFIWVYFLEANKPILKIVSITQRFNKTCEQLIFPFVFLNQQKTTKVVLKEKLGTPKQGDIQMGECNRWWECSDTHKNVLPNVNHGQKKSKEMKSDPQKRF